MMKSNDELKILLDNLVQTYMDSLPIALQDYEDDLKNNRISHADFELYKVLSISYVEGIQKGVEVVLSQLNKVVL